MAIRTLVWGENVHEHKNKVVAVDLPATACTAPSPPR